jgi:hypothetical protein
MIFGASFIFKISSKIAFKNKLEKGNFDFKKMDFESLFQNLWRFSKCAFNQSCREFYSKQLLF